MTDRTSEADAEVRPTVSVYTAVRECGWFKLVDRPPVTRLMGLAVCLCSRRRPLYDVNVHADPDDESTLDVGNGK